MGNTKRIEWVDWMKALAMFFIIAGHCWVPGNQYIYVFSVPCFFIISGYLSHKESDNVTFWRKLNWNMVVPMIIYLAINLCFYNLQTIVNGVFHWSNLYEGPLLSLVGMQGQNYAAGGLKALWFVYTLCICKIIYQFLPQPKLSNPLTFLLILAFIAACVYINQKNIVVYNSIVNVLIAFPFFMIGNFFRRFETLLDSINHLRAFLIFLAGVVITYICGRYNGLTFLYMCSYGNSLTLCLLGGIAGTGAVFVLSKWCSKLFNPFNISVLGGGTLNMLGLHPILIVIFNNILRLSGWTLYIESIIIFLLFIPLNKLVKRNFPLAYGLYRK